MIFETTKRETEFPRTFGVKVSAVYRGAFTLPEGTTLEDGELLRKLCRLLVKKILYIYSSYRSKITAKRLSFLRPLSRNTENLEETPIQCFSTRILDDLAICYRRAWFNLNSVPTRIKKEIFDHSKIREKRLKTFFLQEAVKRGLNALNSSLGFFHTRYLIGLRGIADIALAEPFLIIEFCLTPICSIKHILPRVAAYAFAYRLKYGCSPLALIVSSHDLSIAVVDYSNFHYEKVFKELSWLRKIDIKYVTPTYSRYCNSCIYRLRCPKEGS